jgi:hypothetical protein
MKLNPMTEVNKLLSGVVDPSIPVLLQPGLKDKKKFARHCVKNAIKVIELNIRNACVKAKTEVELKRLLDTLHKELTGGNERGAI